MIMGPIFHQLAMNDFFGADFSTCHPPPQTQFAIIRVPATPSSRNGTIRENPEPCKVHFKSEACQKQWIFETVNFRNLHSLINSL